MSEIRSTLNNDFFLNNPCLSDEQLKNCLLSNSIGYYNTNLTKDTLLSDFICINQEFKSFGLNNVGMQLPCNYSQFLNAWKDLMIPEEYKNAPGLSNRREFLLNEFKKGKKQHDFGFLSHGTGNTVMFFEETVFLEEDPETKDVLAVTIMRDITTEYEIEEKQKQKEIEDYKQLQDSLRDAKMLQVLSDDYECVYYVDLEIDKLIPYRINDSIKNEYGAFFATNPPYSKAIREYILNTVHEDNKDEMLASVTTEKLLEYSNSQKVLTKDYKGIHKGQTSWFQMKIAPLSSENGHHTYLFGFSNINEFKTLELDRYAFEDPLTHGDNYIKFKKRVEELKTPGHIISMDISGFKTINSVCGPQKGDTVLTYIWSFIASCITDSDLAGHVYADRFALFLPGRTDEEIIELTRNIAHTLNFLSIDLEVPNLTPYFGILRWNCDITVEEAYSLAVLAKKKVKQRKDVNYAFFSEEDTKQMIQDKKLEDKFEESLQKGQFEIWYQPKYNPNTKKVIGAEALIRWRNDNGELIPPSAFINLFEQDGLIRVLDEYVFRKVCIQQKDWISEGRQIVPVSVNLSRASLYFKTVPDQYKWIAEKIGINTKFVPIEITESATITNAELNAMAEKFYKAGFPLHMDDFGSGYSSMASLNTMHFDTLKIDKSLIDFIGNYSGDRLLVHTIALAKELGMHVTAEGVENKTQVSFLEDLNCDSIQGYFFSKPLPLKEFEALMANQ